MFRSCVLCNHVWLWGEGCDLGGGLGSRDPRAGSEKQNAGGYDLRQRFAQFIHPPIHLFINVFCQGLSGTLMTHQQLELLLAHSLLGPCSVRVTGA